ncbi:hypothetical protein [Labrenzia sp. OB1]|nr:hypothetical protein [Labrenzia sp. OB1]
MSQDYLTTIIVSSSSTAFQSSEFALPTLPENALHHHFHVDCSEKTGLI